MYNILLFLALTALSIGPLIIWPSRFNIPMLLNIGPVFVAYFVPLVILGDNDLYKGEAFELFATITIWGAVCYMAGLIIGFLLPLTETKFSFTTVNDEVYESRFVKLTQIFLVIGISGMILSFLIMGFVPAFAADPLNAKFFRGAYEVPYMRAAVLFRTSNLILINSLGFGFVLLFLKRNLINLTLITAASLVLLSTLNRGISAFALLTVLGLIFAYKGRLYTYLYLFINSLTVILGSISYYLIGLIFGIDQFTSLYSEDSVWTLIASGSPDISDQIQFIQSFSISSEFTYGKTFLGGLVPGHYKWNPSVWALYIVSPNTDLEEITSGGLRLSVPLWGYTSFSWPGVIIVSLLAGLITGYFTKYLKYWMKSGNISKNIVAITFYSVIGISLSNFYLLSYMMFPPLIVLFFYTYKLKK